jgi:integrase
MISKSALLIRVWSPFCEFLILSKCLTTRLANKSYFHSKFCFCLVQICSVVRFACSAHTQAIWMRGQQAKILSDDNLEDLLLLAETSRHPLRNKVIVLLSAKAGLRAGEIARLTWAMVTDPIGAIGTVLELPNRAAKKKSGRVIPLHEDLRTTLAAWRTATQSAGSVIVSERGGPMAPQSVVVWFANAYRVIGLDGCSSHSGRRTFITRAARLAHHAGGSLRDVQLLAGHPSIQTTQRYIDGDTDAQRKLVSMI